MAYRDPPGCEPLRVWGRLEPRARQVDFSTALQARVHDPLWMLARQWQFGEFKGEDTGSAILTKLTRRLTTVGAVRAGGAATAYDETIPLEARVEQLPIDWQAPTRRASAGRHFLALLAAGAAGLPAAVAQFDARYYAGVFARLFPIARTTIDETDPSNALAVARRRARAGADRVLAALAGRAIDGHALAQAIAPGTIWATLPSPLAIAIHPDHANVVLAALQAYRAWFVGLHVQPAAGAPTAWVPEQLEYQCTCTLPRDDGAMVLVADEYTDGRLDWYAFDQAPLAAASSGPAPRTDVRTVIPTPAAFAGMPNARWWQLEDAAVDLGAIRADTTDVAKILVAEFALLFGNNWFVVPYRQPVGTLAEIGGIVVTDVFGWRTAVGPATGSSNGVWTRWDFFSLAPRTGTSGHVPLGQHLFLPPVLGQVLESAPIESVAFVRDEMANMVWAVETRVDDGNGVGRDGSAFARQVQTALAELAVTLAPPQAAAADSPATAAAAPPPSLRYQLGSTVPEHWIPFLPVHKPKDTRAVRLQRASMPRFFLEGVAPVRPVTSILRPGLRDDDAQDRPLYVNEEEVPRTGVYVEGTMQRARWFGGATLVWHGRRVGLGRGEGGSGLRFDVVETVAK